MSPVYLIKLKITQNSRPFTAVHSVERIVPVQTFAESRLMFVFFAVCYKIPLAVFWQKIFCIIIYFYQKCIFKLNVVNFNM